MSQSSKSLDDLRREIDEIDDNLHDLLMRRAEIVEGVPAVKRSGNTPALRPGREAMILRRLADRHKGRFSRAVMVRLWRELLSGMTAMQAPFAVAVLVPENAPGYWDLARDHYGSHTQMTPFRSVAQVIRAVSEGNAAVGVLPMPQDGEADPWWRMLISADAGTPRVISRLPFASSGNARVGDQSVLAIGCGIAEPSGADRSLFVIETHGEVSRARIFSTMTAAGLPVTFYTSYEPTTGVALNLLEFDDFVTADDARLLKAVGQLGEAVERVSQLGSYPRPLGPETSKA